MNKIPIQTQNTNYQQLFEKLKQNINKSPRAKSYLKERHLKIEKIEVGFNPPGGGRGASGYKDLKNCIIFPLRNKENEIVSFYGRSVLNSQSGSDHYYTKNRKGLYPKYPAVSTRKLILTESVIDCATLLQCKVESKKLKEYEVLALYGTNGLTAEHILVIQQLEHLQEIILWMDGDEAGQKATEKHRKYLKELLPHCELTTVNNPQGEDINSLLDGHTSEIFTQLLQERTIFSSTEEKKQITKNDTPTTNNQTLDTNNPERIIYINNQLTVTVWGGIEKENLSRLRVSLHITSKDPSASSGHAFRDDVNLYSHTAVKKLIQNVAEMLELPTTEIGKTIAWTSY